MIDRTERSAHYIITELVRDGYLVRQRQGRRNLYEVNGGAVFDASLTSTLVGEVLERLRCAESGELTCAPT
jgi:hypothetical protein